MAVVFTVPASWEAGTGIAAELPVTLWVRPTDSQPARLVADFQTGKDATLTVTVDFSGIGAPVAIRTPPPDQVENRPSLGFPVTNPTHAA